MAASHYQMQNMQIERIEEMRISGADEAAIGRMLDAAFDADYDGRSYYQQRHHVRFIVRNGIEIVGHMALCLRAIRMGDALVQTAGLAEVATHPDHRGKGIASALMQAVISESKASPADFLVLFGDEALYAGVGCVSVPNKTISTSYHTVRTGPLEQRQGDKLMVMQLRDRLWDNSAIVDLVGHAF